MKRKRSENKINHPEWNSLRTDLSKYKLSETEIVNLLTGRREERSLGDLRI